MPRLSDLQVVGALPHTAPREARPELDYALIRLSKNVTYREDILLMAGVAGDLIMPLHIGSDESDKLGLSKIPQCSRRRIASGLHCC